MKKMKTLILAICAMLALGTNAKTELTTVRGEHGKLDVKIQTPDNPAELAKAAKAKKKVKKTKKNANAETAEAMKKYPLLVLCHGFGGDKEGKLFDCLVDSLNKKGIAVLRFDFNGHGKSEGKFEDMTVPNEIEDAKCILRYASSLPWVSEIALGGHSQGGVVSAMTSGQLAVKPEQDIKPISALVLLAPAAVLRDDALRGNTFGKMYDPKNPPAKIEMWGGKCLVATTSALPSTCLSTRLRRTIKVLSASSTAMPTEWCLTPTACVSTISTSRASGTCLPMPTTASASKRRRAPTSPASSSLEC